MPQCVIDTGNVQLNTMWLLICGILVFLMQVGFLLLEVGQVRMSSHLNILLKNAMDVSVCSLAWWATGFALAFGVGNDFIGTTYFFGSNYPDQIWFWANWFFQFAFAATATTILSGAVAERFQIKAYLIYTAILGGIIYPVAAHWVWSENGWLSPCRADGTALWKSNGVLDFAGSGVVHMLGGAGAFVAAYLVGPRLGRFTKFGNQPFLEGYSIALATLGAFILWTAWFAFNAGSTANVLYIDVAAKICVNTSIAIAASCLTAFLLSCVFVKEVRIQTIISSLLGGGVAISGPCAYIEPYAAFVVGIISGCVYITVSSLLHRLKIDDPVEVIPVHFFCGMWGLISVGFFGTEANLKRILGSERVQDWGVFYGGSGHQLAVQLLAVAVIVVWTLLFCIPLFLLLRYLGWLRIPIEEEVYYLTMSKHNQTLNQYYQQVSRVEVERQQERAPGIFSHTRENGPVTYDMANFVMQ